MKMDTPDARIQSEAAFQNRRTEQGSEAEPRAKFNYLAAAAKDHYYRALTPVQDKRVLVVGCSEGGVTPLAREGAKVTGIDIADQPIRKLNSAIVREGLQDRAFCTVMNGEDLSFGTKTFDLICCTGVLHHLDIPTAASSWARTLKPNGRAVMIEPMAYHPLVLLYRWFTPSQRTPDEHPLKPKDIRLLRKHFRRVDVTGYALTSVLSLAWLLVPGASSMKLRSAELLGRLDTWLLRRFPFLAYCCWTCLIEASEPLNE